MRHARLISLMVLVLLFCGGGAIASHPTFADGCTWLGLYGDFDRLHLRDAGAQPPVNTILSCFGWGLFLDHDWFTLRGGLRSQLGTSSLNPGYIDDEQLVATLEAQVKYPVSWGSLLVVYPALGLEYGQVLSGTARNADHYIPWLVKVGAGCAVNLSDNLRLGAEASFSASPQRIVVLKASPPSTVFTVTESVGWRLP